jgi:hypothetical protein
MRAIALGLVLVCVHQASAQETKVAQAAANVVFPKTVSPAYTQEDEAKARMHTCVDQYNANKATDGNGGIKWVQPEGGGYYSLCSERLKSALVKIPAPAAIAKRRAGPPQILPGNPSPSTPSQAANPARGSAPLSQAELDAMRARLASLWKLDSVENPEELFVTIRMRLNPDRRLSGAPQVVSKGSSPRYQAAADAAVRAVLQAQPYAMLKDESYEQWKFMDIDFDPKQMMAKGGGAQPVASTGSVEGIFGKIEMTDCLDLGRGITGFVKANYAGQFLDNAELFKALGYLWRIGKPKCDEEVRIRGTPPGINFGIFYYVNLVLLDSAGNRNNNVSGANYHSSDGVNWEGVNQIGDQLRRQEQQRQAVAEQQRQQRMLDQARQQRADAIRQQDAARPPIPSEDAAIIYQIVKDRRGLSFAGGCSSYDYLNGVVEDRSIDGKLGVFLVSFTLLNKSTMSVGRYSPHAEICGSIDRDLPPSEVSKTRMRGVFRMYETGWRLENLIVQP